MAEYIKHTNCEHCGSSDGNAVYDDGSTYCFVCNRATNNQQPQKESVRVSKGLYYKGEYLPLDSRGIDKDTAKKFKVKVDEFGNYIYPLYDGSGEVVATKVRKKGGKDFAITGDFKQSTLFGMNVFGTGGKYLTVVEGQDDALAAYKMLGSKWAVVSIHSASSAEKDIKDNIDYVESFENVVFMLDNDEPGRKASQKCAELLTPGKAKIVTLNSFKDANDYLRAGKSADFQQEFWNSKTFSAVGVVSFADAWDSVVSRKNTKIIPLPSTMPILTAKLGGGLAKGEITVVGALTSIGKTTFVNNLLHGFLSETEEKVGYLGLETTVGELTSGLIDLEAKRKVSSDDSLEKAESTFNSIKWKEQLSIIDHQGSLDLDSMVKKIRNTIVAFDLGVFILDPLQAALPDMNNDTVKQVMDSLLKLAKQTDVSFIIVSHMRKPSDDKPHNVSEYDLLGSSAINQIAFNTILLSRDKMGETDTIKSTTKIQLVKARRTGQTGEAGWLFYDHNTGLLEQGTNPYDEIEGAFDG
jgi:twinkle protein